MANTVRGSEPAKRIRLNSIFVKIAGVVGVAAALLTGLTAVQYTNATMRLVSEELQHAAQEANKLITSNLSGAIRFADDAPIAAQIELLTGHENSETLYGLAIDAAGEVIVAQGNDVAVEPELVALARKAVETGADVLSDDGFLVASPAVFKGEVVGAFATATTPELILAMAKMEHGKVTLAAVATVAVGILLLVLGLRASVARPMTRLARAVDSVGRDELDIDVPGTARGDELGDIGKSVDRMRDSLKAAAETRRESAFRGAAFRASQSAMMMIDRDLNIIYVNRAVTELLRKHTESLRLHKPDFDADALVGRNMDDFHPGELRSRVRRILENPANLPYTATIAVGQARLTLQISAVEDEHGQHIGYVNEWKDVSTEFFTRAAIQALDENMLKADFELDGRFTYGNALFHRAFGRHPDDGKDWAPATAVSERLSQAIARCAGGEADYDVFEVSLPGMPRVFLDGGFTPVKDDKGQVIRISFLGKDVTTAKVTLEAAEAERAAMLEAQAQVVAGLRRGLGRLRDGDLTVAIEEAFSSEYEELRRDFNAAVEQLFHAMRGVIDNASQIRGEASEISHAADELSQRTERQAATLEETAAALDQLTSSVKSASDGATSTNDLVQGARENAETSGEIVREAVDAMDEIASSSQKISKITDVIDDIAFQTNLLALNAGVEAARAGDAGRGFAVVASEVRALAQRSSDAAREINGLISASGTQVKRGVDLVDQAGTALKGIVESVKEISRNVSEIAVASREQSSGLAEINAAINQLDQVTQQNAAMFEETTAASHALTRSAEDLAQTTARFRTDRAGHREAQLNVHTLTGATKRDAPKSDASKPGPLTAPPRAATAVGQTGMPPAADDGWDEF